LLLLGAEVLVRGATRLAAALGVSPLVIGLTLVAFGTSAPELAVSVQAALAARPEIALGNVVGSNIFNVFLVLGLAALLAPVPVAQRLVWLDVPLMIAASALLWVLAANGLGRLDGLLLLAGLTAYTLFVARESRRETDAIREEYARQFGPPVRRAGGGRAWRLDLLLIGGGLGLLVLGARWLVDGAVALARMLGVSDAVIALTIVAAGTSLPEIATSAVAAVRGERDIAVGNVVGSNLFNVLGIAGVAGLLAPAGIPRMSALLHFDLPVMVAAAVACLPIFFTGHVIARWEGALFVAYYGAYTTYLFLNAAQHAALDEFGAVMLAFVIPLTVLTLLVSAVRAVRGRP
jgi:cation:H+ antiporter